MFYYDLYKPYFENEKIFLEKAEDGSRYIEIEVPGFKKDQIDISVQSGYLKIKAEKEAASGKRSYEKTILLPKTLDTTNCSATLEDGILKCSFNLLETAKEKRIEIT